MDTSIDAPHKDGWHSAGTAPRDGTVVIVWRHNAARACLAYVDENGDWAYMEDWPKQSFGGGMLGAPTHWQPLPIMNT